MNVVIVLSVLLLVVIMELFLTKRSLSRSRANATVMAEKLVLYEEFVKNTSVKRFFIILNTFSAEALDLEISLMFKKYFKKVFTALDVTKMHSLILDIKTTQRVNFLKQAFIKAIYEDSSKLLGEALFCSIKDCDLEAKRTLIKFLDELSLESKRAQIFRAIGLLEVYIQIDLGDLIISDYKEEMEINLAELQKMLDPV